MTTFLRSCAIALLFFLTPLAGCGDDDPAGPGGDTTAPLVVSFDPSNDDTGVGLDDDIVVVFSEDMNENSAEGQVLLSSGTVLALVWDDARTLRITHTDWAEGVRIEVTLGTGIADLAGNGLAASYASGFWTQTSSVVLLASTPKDGDTDVNRNTPVTLVFSRQMNLGTLAAATSVDDGRLGRLPVEFTLAQGDGDKVVLTFASALPASSTITVNITTAATAVFGGHLASPVQFSFTTGTALDTTPPTLVSISPANGATIGANTAAIVMTFSEPIDTQRFEPDRIGAQFFYWLEVAGIEPTWSDGGRVMTVPLPTPLPAGLPIVAGFDAFYDLAGNESTTGIDYRVRVSGVADPWPFVDGATFVWYASEHESGFPPASYPYWERMELQSGNTFHLVRYRDASMLEDDGWEVFEPAASQVQFHGFREISDGVPFDVVFTPAVLYQKLPMAIQSWEGSTVAEMFDGEVTIEYRVEVHGQEDVPAAIGGFDAENVLPRAAQFPTMFWIDCWKTTLHHSLIVESDVIQSGVETIWYAPTIGIVRRTTSEVDYIEETTYESEEDLVFLSFPE